VQLEGVLVSQNGGVLTIESLTYLEKADLKQQPFFCVVDGSTVEARRVSEYELECILPATAAVGPLPIHLGVGSDLTLYALGSLLVYPPISVSSVQPKFLFFFQSTTLEI